MDKQYDVVALGELLIDFTEAENKSGTAPLFQANPGGAPCNVLAMLNKLGKNTAFIGKLGEDIFGKQLADTISNIGIDTEGLVFDKNVRTTLAFVKNFENGDRDFSFYRNPGADMMLDKAEVSTGLIKNTRVFHFGTLSMTHEGVREATKYAVSAALENRKLVSFDPNLRPPLWENLEQAKEQMRWGMSKCHILKISDNEIEFYTGEKDFYKGAALLKKEFPNIRLINVTAGADGSYSFYEGLTAFVPGFCLGGTIDTTGAGDTFCACAIDYILETGMFERAVTEADLEEMLRFANAAAYLVTTKKGAINSMPDRAQIEKIVKTHKN